MVSSVCICAYSNLENQPKSIDKYANVSPFRKPFIDNN